MEEHAVRDYALAARRHAAPQPVASGASPTRYAVGARRDAAPQADASGTSPSRT